MKTLSEHLSRMENKAGVGQTLRKHLEAVGIVEWADVSRSALYDLRDHLADSVAPGTARTIMANFKALLNRVRDEVDIPQDYAKILSAKGCKPVKIYLSEEDLEKLEGAYIHTERQQYIKNVFLICAYTGLRVSDAMNLTTENIVGGSLHFVAQKTKKAGVVPLKNGLAERIIWVAAHRDCRVTLKSYNEGIRLMCKNAGIDEEVKIFKAGKEQTGPKWQFVSSHTARISTASCLNKRGVPIGDIMRVLQHSSQHTTENYIVRDNAELSPEAMGFFR